MTMILWALRGAPDLANALEGNRALPRAIPAAVLKKSRRVFAISLLISSGEPDWWGSIIGS
jgi:hypothetical protein